MRTELVNAFAGQPQYERQRLNSRMNRGMVRQRRGDMLADKEQFDEADTFYAEARSRVEAVQQGRRKLLERLGETSDIRHDLVQNLAQGYYNMAKVTLWLGDFDATGEHVAAAVREFDALLAEDPNHLANQYDQAHCLLLGGDAKSEQMRLLDESQEEARRKFYDEALQTYERARTTLEELAGKSTSVPKYRRAVAQACMRIGDLHLLHLQDRAALAAYQSAADIFTPMVAEFPAYQPLLDEANGAVADTKQFIQEAAAASKTIGERGTLVP